MVNMNIKLLPVIIILSIITAAEPAAVSNYAGVEKLFTIQSKDIIGIIPDVTGLTKPCKDSLHQILQELSPPVSPWAYQLFDSWGKVGSGILSGRAMYPGSFDECKDISGMTTKAKDTFYSKYCTLSIVVPAAVSVRIGACVPNMCADSDVANIYKSVLKTRVPAATCSATCRIRNPTLNNRKINNLYIVMSMVGICLLATLYDGMMQLMCSRKDKELGEIDIIENSKTPSTIQPAPPQGIITRTILAFSVYSNIGKILSMDQPVGSLTCLNGIRFFSMTWIVQHHITWHIFHTVPKSNPSYIRSFYKTLALAPVLKGNLAVDSFFALSGLLASYLFLGELNRKNPQIKGFLKSLPLRYLHRYLRLTPAYGFLMLVNSSLICYLWDGPFWPDCSKYEASCFKTWHLNLLYINNLYMSKAGCATWGWYLANDMQFSIVAPFIIYIFHRSQIKGFIFCSLTILASCMAAYNVSNQQHNYFVKSTLARYNFHPLASDPNRQYYYVPWVRYQSYGVGILAGFILFKLKQRNAKIPKVLNVLLWAAAAGICISVVFGPFDVVSGKRQGTLYESNLFNGFARASWAVGVCCVIISCSLGHGGWVNDFLSWKGFFPLSKVSYCAYLIHMPIGKFILYGGRDVLTLTHITVPHWTIFCIGLACVTGFFFSVLFEMPFINLDRIYLTPKSLNRGRR